MLDQLIHLEKVKTILAPVPYLKHKQQVSNCQWLHCKDLQKEKVIFKCVCLSYRN